MSNNLKSKAVKGISWSLSERLGVNIFRLIIGIVLARLLMPEDFGLIAMITVFFSIAEVLVNSGFGQAYIQKKNIKDADANTVFIINFTISIILYVLLYIFSPAIASFYNEEQLIQLTRVLGLVVIINSFNIVQIAQIRRELNFKRKTIIALISIIISGTLGIISAFIGFGVWSLVIQQLTNKLILTIGLYFTSAWRLKIEFSKESFTSLFSFGVWLLAANIFQKIFDNIYRLSIGKFYPASELGYFTKAKQFQGLISEQFVWAIGIVAFPVLSKVQDQKDKISQSIMKFIKYTSFIITPLLMTLLVVSEPFVLVFLTNKWIAMVPYLQLMCVLGIIQPIHELSMQAFQAIGKSKLVFNLGIIKNALRVLNIYLFYKHGVLLIILGEIVLVIITYLINTFYMKKYMALSFIKQAGELKWIFLLSGVAALLGYFILGQISNNWLQFFIPSIGIILSYFTLMILFQKKFLKEIYNLKTMFLRKQ